MKNDKGYESDGGDSNASLKTVKSVNSEQGGGGSHCLQDELPHLASSSHLSRAMSRRTTAMNSLQSSVQVKR